MHERQDNNTGAEHGSRIRSAVKNELREAQSEVKLTKINATSLFYSDTPSFLNTKVCIGRDYKIVERQCLSPSQASR